MEDLIASKMDNLPPNVHVSKHPCLVAKLSQLRSKNTTTRETEQLIHDISIILGTEALSGLELVEDGTVSTKPVSRLAIPRMLNKGLHSLHEVATRVRHQIQHIC